MNYSDLEILYLSPLMPDYLHDCTFLGLHELGCNVVEFPRKPSLHGTPYTELFRCDQLTFTLPENKLRKENPDLIITAAKMPHENQEMIERLRTLKILHRKDPPVPMIVLDGLDWAHQEYPFGDYSYVFKRELYEESEKMKSLSFCAIPEPFMFIPFKDRQYDLSFVATSSHERRFKIAEYLKNVAPQKFGLNIFVYVEKQPLPREEYLRVLSESRTSISMRGAGLDCYRYWEIASKGTVLISEDLNPLLIKNDFLNRDHCFKFKYSEDMMELERVLDDLKNYYFPEALQIMALNALRHTNNFHTPKNRAEYVLQKVLS
jgi:hypothetical protein